MNRSVVVVTILTAACAAPVQAEKLGNDFRRAFEQVFLPKRTWAVVVQGGIPTTSIYGVAGGSDTAHYSIDVVGGRWKTSTGWLDSDQKVADYLRPGELMELDSISYKDNRVDLRMVSLEAHKVTRGEGFSEDTDPEPVATNFKFFLPFPESRSLGPADVPAVREYIAAFLEVYEDETQARVRSAQLVLQNANVRAPAPAARGGASELATGMTPLQVAEVLGLPTKEVVFEARTKWTYPDVTVVFENCRVVEVDF